MTDIQAAQGLVQLKKLSKIIIARKKIAKFYDDHLSKIEWLKLPKEPKL